MLRALPSPPRRQIAASRPFSGTGYQLGHWVDDPLEANTTEKKGQVSETARKANAKASHEGSSNPRTSSSAQAELGRKGGKSKS